MDGTIAGMLIHIQGQLEVIYVVLGGICMGLWAIYWKITRPGKVAHPFSRNKPQESALSSPPEKPEPDD